MSALIGALRVSLSADTAKFETGMRRAQATARASSSGISKSLGSIKAGFAGLAAGLSIGMFTSAIKGALDYAGSLGETAGQLGVTTKELQTFRFAAQQNGASLEEADKALGKFSLSVSKALSGSKEMTAAFAAMGVSLQDLRTKSKTDLIGQIADAMIKTGGASANAAAGVTFFSKGFGKIIPTLDLGSAGMNELAAAAEKLGIVLSDEQIQKADEAADKLGAVNTMLKAQIAGVVADNADAILQLANAFGQLVGSLAKAAGWLATVSTEMHRMGQIAPGLANILSVDFAPLVTIMGWFGNKGGSSVTMKLPEARPAGGGRLSQFLAPSGGGKPKRAKEDHSAEKALRESNQFDQEIRRANIEILQARKDRATDYVEQASIAIQIKNEEQAAFEAELQYRIASKDLTKVQAAKLQAAFISKDALDRQAILDEEEAKRAEDFQELQQHDFDRQREILEARSDLAETASERRKIELQLLQIAYDQKKQALDNIIETSKDFKEIEDARRDLATLNKTHPLAKQSVLANTRGPMEDWLASLPTTAAKAQEAMERLQVQGFEGLIDSVLALSEGVGSATDSLLETLKQFLLGLARIEFQKMLGNTLQSSGGLSGIIGAIGGLFGGGAGASSSVAASASAIGNFGFASGGFTGNISRNRFAGFVHGGEGVLNSRGLHALGIPNMNALNRGVPLSAVTGNDNWHGGRGPVTMNVYTPDGDSFRRSEGQTTRALKRKLG